MIRPVPRIDLGSLLLLLLLLLLSSHAIVLTTTVVTAETCNLCTNGTTPDPHAMFRYRLATGQYAWSNCTHGNTLASSGYFTNCTELHAHTHDICCFDPSTPTNSSCPLCGDDYSGLPYPDRVVGGKTCRRWQTDAGNDFDSNCGVWRRSIGRHCGCGKRRGDGDEDGADGHCRICGGEEDLPNRTAKILWDEVVGGVRKETYCVEYELDMNRLSSYYGRKGNSCGFEQERLREVCRCDRDRIVKLTNSGVGFVIKRWRLWAGVVFFMLV